jgi:small subunit ribosomal protein S11
VEKVMNRAKDEFGVNEVEIYVKGPGAGRDAALRAIRATGVKIALIADITPVPHNGPRPSKKRRV